MTGARVAHEMTQRPPLVWRRSLALLLECCTVSLRRLRKKLGFWGLVMALCVVGVMVALALSRIFEAFYTEIPQGYEPKDVLREKIVETKPAE